MTSEDPRAPRDLRQYRANAGIVLFNREGLCWSGKRYGGTGPWVWQWPQGGIDRGEDPEAAARRELYEETGATPALIEKLGQVDGWLCYDFPPKLRASKPRGLHGQKQRWYAYRYLGTDEDFDLTAVPPQEFERFEWITLDDAVARIIPWKRPVYEAVADAFAKFGAPAKP